MKSKVLISTVVFFALVFSHQKANAQTDSCATYLKNANTFYEERSFDQTIKLLQTALSVCNLDKSEKIQAHKLLALSYTGIDNLEAADKEAEAIMKISPNYTPDKFKDDPKYSTLFDKFKPVPVFRVGFVTGINIAKTNVVKSYSVYHGEDASQYSIYTDKTGFQLGLTLGYRAIKNLWVELGGQYRVSNYEHKLTEVENRTINYSEKLTYVDIPLSVKYYILDKKISPYVEAGATFSNLTNSLSTTTRDDSKDLVNRTNYRNTFMVGYFGGVGASYKLKSFQVIANVRYTLYNDNLNKEGTRYSDAVNVFKYYYIDDDFTMDNLQINLGLVYNLTYKNIKK